MGTRNMADAVGHGHHGQTEGDVNAKETNGATSEDGSAATSENEDECAEQFGEKFVTCFHNCLNFNWLIIRND
jgi:hypothetical protein